MARFQIVIVRPAGYPHSDAFNEVAETLMYGLQELGHDAKIGSNFFSAIRWNIVLGAHLLPGAVLPERSIIYNLEAHDSPFFEKAQRIMGKVAWWDYSHANVAALTQVCRPYVFHVPIGYMPQMTRIASREQDIDVLLYGSMNVRRLSVLESCKEVGLRTHAVFNIYGRERDELISRSKVVLNVHFYESRIFEVVRCSYLMANSKCVVSEESHEVPRALFPGVLHVEYAGLAETCRVMVKEELARKAQEKLALETMRQVDESAILQGALGAMGIERCESLSV